METVIRVLIRCLAAGSVTSIMYLTAVLIQVFNGVLVSALVHCIHCIMNAS